MPGLSRSPAAPLPARVRAGERRWDRAKPVPLVVGGSAESETARQSRKIIARAAFEGQRVAAHNLKARSAAGSGGRSAQDREPPRARGAGTWAKPQGPSLQARDHPRRSSGPQAPALPGLSFASSNRELDAIASKRQVSGFGPTPRPVDRGSLFARSGHPAPTRAQNIHVLLSAIPGRQDAAPAARAALFRSPAVPKPR